MYSFFVQKKNNNKSYVYWFVIVMVYVARWEREMCSVENKRSKNER